MLNNYPDPANLNRGNFAYLASMNETKVKPLFEIALRKHTEAGKTVLTGNKMVMDIADVAILEQHSENIVERTKDRDRKIDEEGARLIVNREALEFGETDFTPLTKGQFLSDVLFKSLSPASKTTKPDTVEKVKDAPIKKLNITSVRFGGLPNDDGSFDSDWLSGCRS